MSTASQTPTAATPDTPKLLKKASTSDTKAGTPGAQMVYGCQHIQKMLTQAKQGAIDGYTRALGALRKEGNISHRFYKIPGGGATVTTGVTYLCLQCPNVSISRERHRKEHAFAIESTYGYLYCHDCKDFVYDPTLEDIRAPNRKKRKYSAAMSDTDKKFIAINTTTTPCGATGLRGFYNMGQTCFMSVILQSLMHNPLIKSYYLQEGHRATDCEREACTSCAFDEIIQDFFATEKHEGYGAVHMLQACWKGGGGLAGYSQQDAHEFLGFLLNSLHEADINDESKQDAQNCECVIHQTFSGMMRSTVTCNTCKNTTATSEPFMDLSLDVKNAGTRTIKKKLGMINGTQTIKEAIPVDLTECLERFTTAETLSSDSYQCRKCNAAREAKKKLSLVQLPPTIPIHLKRFSHSKANSQSTKVDSRVRFPFRLNLEPYIAKASAKEANGRESVENDGDATDGKKAKKDQADGSGDTREAIYELASVVVHKGKIDNGHYISYSRQDREWFRFDDSMVVQVDEREVLGAEAYMLFYIVSEV